MLRAAILCSLLIAGASAAGSYIITAPQEVQPGSSYSISVDILNGTEVRVQAFLEETVFLDGTQKVNVIANVSGTFGRGRPGTLRLEIDAGRVFIGSLQLRIRGTGDLQFERTQFLSVKSKVVVSFIQTDKPIYKPGQLVRYRMFAVRPDLSLYTGGFSYEIRDPNNNKIKVETNVTSETSVVEGSFQLGDQPVFGTWTIELSLLAVKETSSVGIEVTLYELPKFEVTVETQPYALIRDELFTGKVTAKYTFGQPVKGFVEIFVGPNQGRDICGALPRSTQIRLEIDGEVNFQIPREDISRIISLFEGTIVRITAFVTEEATGVRLNGSTVVTFYQEEFQVKFTENTPNVFKPGLQYTAFIKVTTPDKKPPVNRNITVSVYTSVNYELTLPDQSLYNLGLFSGTYGLPGQNLTVPPNGLLTVNIDIPLNATSITIKATVNNVQVTKTAEKSFSPSNSYLQLTLLDKNIKSGTTVTVRVNATRPVNQLFYKVLSRGSVVDSAVVEGNGRATFTFEIEVTTEFAPTSHLLAYYIRGAEEIVADSLAFQVAGIFKNNVTVSFNKNRTEPNTEIILEATATPGSQIFVMAVDKSVLLLKTGNDITSEKVNEGISQLDGGQRPTDPEFPLSSDSTTPQGIFDANGQVLITDLETPFPPSRFVPFAENRFQPSFSRAGGAFSDIDETASFRSASIQLQAVERVRNFFPDAWFFENATACRNGSATFITTVPDTITSWIANAFATSPIDGLGVALQTARLEVFLSFFVTFNLPTSIVRREQLVLQVVVSNFRDVELTNVVVTLKGSRGFLSVKASKNGLEVLESGNQVVTIERVKAQEQVVVNYPLVFTEIGITDIEVTAQTPVIADGIRRQIVVKSEGAPISFNYPLFISLNGQNQFSDSKVFTLPDSAVNGSDSAIIKATGDLIGPSLNSLASLVQLPTGCGEQNLAKIAPNVFIAIYLEAIGQFIGNRRAEIIAFLEAGLQNQLAYQRLDGGFSAFGNSDETGSTWLAAFFISTFVEVRSFIFVDAVILFRANDWLVERQNKDGSFSEFGRILDSSIQGSATGPALSAFVGKALLAVQSLATTDCAAGGDCQRADRYTNATANVIRYLENLVDSDSINDQLSLALVSNFLTLANSSRAETVFAKLLTFARNEGSLIFWAGNSTITPGQVSDFFIWRPPRVQSRPLGILITAYVIQTYIARNQLQEAFPSVLWLTTQRNPSGGFATSQDTAVAIQALALYASKTINAETNINIKVSNGVVLAEFNITQENALELMIRELRRAPPRVDVVANGTGFALLEVAILFYTNKALSTPSFDVSTVFLEDSLDTFNMLICTKWLWTRESGMVVQEIGIPSGFTPDLESLGNIAGLKKIERSGNSVNIYFYRIDTISVCYSIRMTRTDKVVRIQDNNILTKSYYNPSDQTLVFYLPKSLRDSTVCDVSASSCT